MKLLFSLVVAASLGLLAGCDAKQRGAPAQATAHKHEHKPPHQGTPVVLGHEAYHIELVLDAPTGKLQAYVLDGEMENYVRVQAESFEVQAKVQGGLQPLVFKAVANQATGEKIGDTSMYEARADWLKTNPAFDATLTDLIVKGQKYQNIQFNFPKGNDTDEK